MPTATQTEENAMNLNELKVEMTVLFETAAGEEMSGVINDIAKGWIAVEELDSGEIFKIRAKQIVEILENEEEGDESEGGPMARKLKRYAQHYSKATNAAGDSTKICGDAVSILWVQLGLVAAYAVAAGVLELEVSTLRSKYEHLNPGQQKMILGNRVRGWVKGHEDARAAVVELTAIVKSQIEA